MSPLKLKNTSLCAGGVPLEKSCAEIRDKTYIASVTVMMYYSISVLIIVAVVLLNGVLFSDLLQCYLSQWFTALAQTLIMKVY